MAELDRSVFIALLNRLGAADDAEALAAARELHAAIAETGVSWDDLLVPDSQPDDDHDEPADAESEAEPVPPAVADAGAPEDDDDESDEDEDADEDDDEDADEDDENESGEDADDEEDEDGEEDEGEEDDEADEEEGAEAAAAPAVASDSGEDRRILERLRARKGISEDLREELTGFQRDLDKGKLAAMDRRYIRALAKRMGL